MSGRSLLVHKKSDLLEPSYRLFIWLLGDDPASKIAEHWLDMLELLLQR